VHYWLLGMRGGEKVVESLCRILPDADIFTLFYDPEQISDTIRSHRVISSFLNPLRRSYRSLLPLMPLALEGFDLRDYDLVVSSESGPAKGVLTSSHTRHVCYCHTPMRYLWDLYPAYRKDWIRSPLKRLLMAPLANYLRLWDYASAARVDEFVANSRNVQSRIRKTYRRDSRVVYPPVETDTFFCAAPEDYYLVVGELVAYKRIRDAVEYFARSGRRLKIVGDGPEYKTLRELAGRTVEFCGRVSDAELRVLYARTRAVLVPGEEDFGIVAVEALASGKPLIGLARGGLAEIALPRPDSFLYREAGVESLGRAIDAFERHEPLISPSLLQSAAARFSAERFQREMEAILFDRRSLLESPVPLLQKVHKSTTTTTR
jgi:glycosyltransferase involved in cell wall biosynthesis